jgi:hypothetical protein
MQSLPRIRSQTMQELVELYFGAKSFQQTDAANLILNLTRSKETTIDFQYKLLHFLIDI